MLEIIPIPAFTDNYIWLLRRGLHATVIDPGEADAVMQILTDLSLTLDSILITHHHSDHIGGVEDLIKHYPAEVYAPRHGLYQFPHTPVAEGDTVRLHALGVNLSVMEVPGHTLDHVAYHGENYLFCGDTLFGAGCGRLFEGTAEQLYHSLQRFAGLPKGTLVYCAHEYTEKNLGFARVLEPENPLIAWREADTRAARKAGTPSLPSTIGLELETNPFLRCHISQIQAASKTGTDDPVTVFSAIRMMRNHY